MKYKSKKPTKERRKIFKFMEQHKVKGTVSGRKVGRYITKEGFKLEARGSKKGEYAFGVLNKRGSEVMRGLVTPKKRVRMWYVV